jgi:carbon-monoxide dehydrogenase large subunit
VTLAQQPRTVKPLGVQGAGQARCIAWPQTTINAILDALASIGIDHIDMRVQRAVAGARTIRSARAGRRRGG